MGMKLEPLFSLFSIRDQIKTRFGNLLPLRNLMFMAETNILAREIIAFVILQKNSNAVME